MFKLILQEKVGLISNPNLLHLARVNLRLIIQTSTKLKVYHTNLPQKA